MLYLGSNRLDAAEVRSLAEALKVNQSLTTLNLAISLIDEAKIQEIEEGLQTNRERIKSTCHQTLITLVILLRQAQSPQSQLPFEIWQSIVQQLDFPSLMKGYRTSHALASFLTQPNIFKEFNQRLQAQQSVRLVETHGTKQSESSLTS